MKKIFLLLSAITWLLLFNAAVTVTNNGTMNISGNNGFQNNAGTGTFINTLMTAQ